MPLTPDSLIDYSADVKTTPLILLCESDVDAHLENLSAPQAAWARSGGFSGKADQIALLPSEDGTVGSVLLGVGPTQPAAAHPWVLAKAATSLPEGVYSLAPQPDCPVTESLALGWLIAQYRFDRYKKINGAAPKLMLGDGYQSAPILQKAEAVATIRDLINTPAEDMGPADLEDVVAELAERFGAQFRSIVGDDLLDENFPSIHAVGRAATEGRAPRLLDLQWAHADADDQTPLVTLVGKGVCFDTGGLNIKTGNYMRLMKKDMGGAAHAIGLAQLILAADLKVKLRLLVSAVENSVDGSAFRPGDILQTRKGLTVEVGNTDAEGRLVLSDALALACEETPDLIMDFATLTGAARVALGADLPATYVNDDTLWAELETAGRGCGDPLWRMPLWAPYDDQLSSPIADVSNISDSPLAGSITAALFLQRFVGPDIPWVHFDLFGWSPSAKPGRPVGAAAQTLFASFHALKARFDV